MLLELSISKVLLEGKGEESAEGERETEWWEKIVKSSPQIFYPNGRKGVQRWGGEVGGGGGGGGEGGTKVTC